MILFLNLDDFNRVNLRLCSLVAHATFLEFSTTHSVKHFFNITGDRSHKDEGAHLC